MQLNATSEKSTSGMVPRKNIAFENYISFRALGGLLVDDSEKIVQWTQDDFCKAYDVNPSTVWRWKKETPNLADLIEKRRNEIVPLARISKAYNQLFLLGMQSQDKRAAVDALKAYLGHFGNLQLPTQRTEVEAGNNLMELLNQARKKNIIEAEVVDDTGPSPSAD